MPPAKAGSIVRGGLGFSEGRNSIQFEYAEFEICVEHSVGSWSPGENVSLELSERSLREITAGII